MLDVRDLRKSYGSAEALAGVSFSVAPGELFGLLGPNGAGKTTLMSILSGLIQANAGQVFLAGKHFQHERERRQLIGIVPQDLAIYPELTARENLLFFGQLYGVGGAELQRRVEQILAAVALADRADHRADTFSGGMKRRLNLAAALVHAPQLLLLDEPTTGVDPQSRNHIFEEVRRLNRAGMTIVYTSHYMEEVQALCPRIGILDRGRLIACDRVQNLLSQLPGFIRLRVGALPERTLSRLNTLNEMDVRTPDAQTLEIRCRDVKQAIVQVVSILAEERVEMSGLETVEPTLEEIFLHLTGRGLRD